MASHDTARLLTIAGGDTGDEGERRAAIASVCLSTLLLMTFPGAPCIYYGDEVGLGGGFDPDCRRVFPKQENWNLDIFQCHRELIQLRRHYPALQLGTYQTLIAEGMFYGFIRTLETSQTSQYVAVFVNADESDISISCSLATWGNFNVAISKYGTGLVTIANNIVEVKLPARTGLIVELQ